MPKREKKSRPKPHKVRNSLAVYVDKQRIVFGNYDDPVAWQKYADFCEEQRNGETETPAKSVPPASGGNPPNTTALNPVDNTARVGTARVGELVTQFLEFAKETKNPSDFSNYKKPDKGVPIKYLINPV